MALRPLSTYFRPSRNWEDIENREDYVAVHVRRNNLIVRVGTDRFKRRFFFTKAWSGVRKVARGAVWVAHPITVGAARARRGFMRLLGVKRQPTDSYYRRGKLHRQDRAAQREHDKLTSDVAERVFAPPSSSRIVHPTNTEFQETTKNDLAKIYRKETFRSGRWIKGMRNLSPEQVAIKTFEKTMNTFAKISDKTDQAKTEFYDNDPSPIKYIYDNPTKAASEEQLESIRNIVKEAVNDAFEVDLNALLDEPESVGRRSTNEIRIDE